MKKSDLKTGMRVKVRNGGIYLVIKDVQHASGHQELAFVSESGFMRGSNYNGELTSTFGVPGNYDVMEVFNVSEDPKNLLNSNFLNLDRRFSIWRRQEYTEEQKEIFKALKLLGFNYIARDEDDDLVAYDVRPNKAKAWWYNKSRYNAYTNRVFNKQLDFIKWEDTEPFEIPTL